ncbi:MAG: BON domain-containing protein [Lautropia sp.]
MSRLWNPVVAILAGAAAMYYFDPDRGRRRRAMLRDRVLATTHGAEGVALAKARHSANRARGLLASTLSRLGPLGEPRSDAQLRERIRAKIGRIVSEPRAIHIEVDDGNVEVRGHVPPDEYDSLLFAIAALPGVHHVDNHLVADDGMTAAHGAGRRRSGLRAVR